MTRNNIITPRFLTTEPNEHNIAGWKMRKREATVLEVNKMEHAGTNRTRAYLQGDFKHQVGNKMDATAT